MRFALIAGEISGDLLGAAIINALRERFPDGRFEGVAGPHMTAAGCQPVARSEELAVMGLVEVVPRLPHVLALRHRLVQRWRDRPPDVVIGIDAPDFNLPLERSLHRTGCRTVHVVSPSVWAWRAGRAKTVARAADMVLCLLPFEPQCYQEVSVEAVYIGHPLADELVVSAGPAAARASLGLSAELPVVAVLPGSRAGEVRALAKDFAQAAALIAARVEGAAFAVPLAHPKLREPLERATRSFAAHAHWRFYDGRSREVMQAADVVLLASGTATLECLLLGRPMVVGYRASPITAWLLRSLGLLKIDHFSLPNLLCDSAVVPEFIQEQATAARFATAVGVLLEDGAARAQQTDAFVRVREQLRCGAARRGADAIARLLGRSP